MARTILYLTLGFPGSGKTHFCKRFADKLNIPHLNSDRMRLEMFEQPSHKPEEHEIVFSAMDYMAEELLSKGISVIYDANINKLMHRQEKRDIAKSQNAEAVLLWFKAPLDVALGRIENRGTEDDKYFRNISAEVLHGLKSELEEPLEDESYIEIDGTKPFKQQIKMLNKHGLAGM